MKTKLLDDSFGESVNCSLWIDQEEDVVIINFNGASGGVFHYLSENDGLLLSHIDDETVVIGMFFEGLLKHIQESDNEELQLRKYRYFEGENVTEK